MKSLRYKQVIGQASNTELAIEKALKELKITKEQATSIQILQQPRKGFLGFWKRDAKVLVKCYCSPDEIAERFLRECLRKMGMNPELTFSPGPVAQSRYIQIDDKQLEKLADRKGRMINSFQYLVNLVANRDANQPIHYRLDLNGSRKERDRELIQLAQRVAKIAKQEQRAVKLEPMSAFERKMIHNYFKDDPVLTTESEGVEPHRSVVVKLKKFEHGTDAKTPE